MSQEFDKRLRQIHAEQEALLRRISGLSDPILAEQCTEEFKELERQLAVVMAARDAQTEQQFNAEVREILEEESEKRMATYDWVKFSAETFANTILTEQDRQRCARARVRYPRDCSDRRTMLFMAQFLDCRIEILNPSNDVLDTLNLAGARTIIVVVKFTGGPRSYDLADKRELMLGVWKAPQEISGHLNDSWGSIDANDSWH